MKNKEEKRKGIEIVKQIAAANGSPKRVVKGVLGKMGTTEGTHDCT